LSNVDISFILNILLINNKNPKELPDDYLE